MGILSSEPDGGAGSTSTSDDGGGGSGGTNLGGVTALLRNPRTYILSVVLGYLISGVTGIYTRVLDAVIAAGRSVRDGLDATGAGIMDAASGAGDGILHTLRMLNAVGVEIGGSLGLAGPIGVVATFALSIAVAVAGVRIIRRALLWIT